MSPANDGVTQAALSEWRRRILNGFLLFTAAAAMPALVVSLVGRVRQHDWGLFAAFSVAGLVLLALALLRRIDSRIRAWGILLVGYAAAIPNLVRNGLTGSGPWYLLVLPVIALILVGLRGSLVCSLLSLLMLAATAYLGFQGLLAAPVSAPSQTPGSPWAALTVLVALLIVTMVLLFLFYRFQERTLVTERRSRAGLAEAQALLAKTNETLEQKVQERTSELARATRQAERAQQQKDALLAEMRVVLDAIDYGILLLGPDLRARMGNRALRELWGLPERIIEHGAGLAEIIGYNRDTGLHAVPKEGWRDYVESRVQAVRQGAIAPCQVRRGDGRVLEYQAVILPGGGRVLTYFDITELARQNEYLAALNDTTLGLIMRRDLHELLELIVTRAAQLVGTANGFIYLLDGTGSELECKVGVGALKGLVGGRLRRGEGVSGAVWQNGQPLVVADYDAWPTRATPIARGLIGAVAAVPLTVGGQFAGVIGVAQDSASHRTVSQEELAQLIRFAQLASVALENVRLYNEAQREKSYFASLLLNSPAAVVVSDRSGAVTSWNPAAERLFGYDEAEALGRNVNDLTAPAGLRQEAEVFTRQSISGFGVRAVTQRTRRDGTLVDVDLATVPLKKDDGTPGTLAIYHDITELKRTEEALRLAKEAAEAATQAKSEFLATMSHEIRTPMNAIIGMTGLLLDTELTPDQRDFAETVRNSGDALLTIINDILDFSKIEAGKMDLERQAFDVRECVESALDLMKVKTAEKGLELACEIAPDVPSSITGDVTRLRQVLVNLLSNAVKFTERGEVVVTVTAALAPGTALGEQKGYDLHFVVKDTGIGIPAERMGRLFRAFSQVDASTARKYGGTGLGLAVSKRLTEMMGGTMWVESEGVPGKGSEFHFTVRAPEAAAQVRSRPVGEAPELRGRRVLIVDDSATSRRILTLQMQGWGMLPQAAASGQEALSCVRQEPGFDLAIVDLHMPEMDGVDLAQALRASGAGPALAQLPLILLSSLGDYGREIAAGLFAACLTKPIRAAALFDALMGVFLQERQVTPVSARARPEADMAKRLPLRILLAEDYVVNQKVALRLLAQMGYRADVAADGLEALHALERQPYDVVLMDVQMPEMDGLEATRQIRARWSGGPRIIAMTANAMQGDREMCLAAGMDDYVSKPIRVDELVQALARCAPPAQGQAPG